MPFFRTLISILYLIFYIIISIFIYPFEYFKRKKNPKAALSMSQKLVTWGLRCEKVLCGAKVAVIGKENIPKDQACVFIGNHRSYYDIVVAYPELPIHSLFIVKDTIQKLPAIGSWMKRTNCLALKRDDPRQGLEIIKKAIEYVKDGSNIVVFPEGTRNKEEGIASFHGGSFKIATKSKACIVPMVITNTREIFEAQLPWLRAQDVSIEFLPAIDTSNLSREEEKELPDKVHSLMLETYKKNKELYPAK